MPAPFFSSGVPNTKNAGAVPTFNNLISQSVLGPQTFTYAGQIDMLSGVGSASLKIKVSVTSIDALSTITSPVSKTKVPAVSIAEQSTVTSVLSKTKVPAVSIAAQSTITSVLLKIKVSLISLAAQSAIAASVSKIKVPVTSLGAQSTITSRLAKTEVPITSDAAQSTIEGAFSFIPAAGGTVTYSYAGVTAIQSTIEGASTFHVSEHRYAGVIAQIIAIAATTTFQSSQTEIDHSGGYRAFKRTVNTRSAALAARVTLSGARVSAAATSEARALTLRTSTRAVLSSASSNATATAFRPLLTSIAPVQVIAGSAFTASSMQAALQLENVKAVNAGAFMTSPRLRASSSMGFASVAIGPDALEEEFQELLLLMEMDLV